MKGIKKGQDFATKIDQAIGNCNVIDQLMNQYIDSGSRSGFYEWGMQRSEFRSFKRYCEALIGGNDFDREFRAYIDRWVVNAIASTQPLPHAEDDGIDFDQWFDSYYDV